MLDTQDIVFIPEYRDSQAPGRHRLGRPGVSSFLLISAWAATRLTDGGSEQNVTLVRGCLP